MNLSKKVIKPKDLYIINSDNIIIKSDTYEIRIESYRPIKQE